MKADEQMRIKSYFARTVDQALADARAELGDEAVLLNTRKVAATPTANSGYELTFGAMGEMPERPPSPSFTPAVVRAASAGTKQTVTASAANQTAAAERSVTKISKQPTHPLASRLVSLHRELDEIRESLPAGLRASSGISGTAAKKDVNDTDRRLGEPLASELARLRDQMDEIQRLLATSAKASDEIGRRVPEIASIYSHLLSADVDPELAKQIAVRVENVLSSADSRGVTERRTAPDHDPRRLERLIRDELESRVALAPQLGTDTHEITTRRSVVVLIGPRGVGKTTALAKLAVSSSRFGDRHPARFLFLDPSRSTADFQLQSVATNYKIAFEEVSTWGSLGRQIAEARREETVFIDTPGYSAGDVNLLDAAAVFAECPAVDVHLVVPAYMKSGDLRECIQTYAPFQPSKLLVTKFDEAKTFGSIYSEAARARLKLSFVTNGPGIPHGIRAITPEDLLEMAFSRKNARAHYVA